VTPEHRRYFLQFTIVFAAYFIAGKLGQATTSVRSSNLGPVWPAYGIALAAVLLYGYRIWPAVASASFVIAFLSPESYGTALGQTAGATLAVLTGARLLRIADFDNSISRLRDAFALILCVPISAIVSASIGTLVLRASNSHVYSGFGSAWLIYWLGDSTGALLVTPLMLTIPDLCRIRELARLAELLCLLVTLVGVSSVVFADLPMIPVTMLAFAILPLIIWAAMRFGVSGAAFSILIVATVTTVETTLGSGTFAGNTPFINGVQLDVFFTVLSLAGLTLAALCSERERAEQEREQSVRKQVAMEVRLQDEELVRSSEERLRLAQLAAHMGTFERDMRTGVLTWTREMESLYGLPPGGFCGTQAAFENLLHPDDRRRVLELVDWALKTGQPTNGEWRVVWPDGSVHWIAGRWQVFKDESDEPLRVLGVNIDVSDRKVAEEALAGMTRKLIEAQEQERARIGRELHDDINQRLAMLAVELEQLRDNPSEIDKLVGELRNQMVDISNDVQALSHELHSSKLEYLGVVAGMKSWCKEFGNRHQMEIDFKSDVPNPLSFEIGLCLYRVLQEALHNAVKHSGVKGIQVQLAAYSSEVHLIVSDLGRGFDFDAALQGKGLGLTSMRERVRLVNGTISIESKPMAGTTIHVRVPLGSEHVSQRSAG
jgi:PAS domain S-box-containing protein